MTILQTINVEQLILLSMMFRHTDGVNLSYQDVKFTYSVVIPDIDPDIVITALHEAKLVDKAEDDYQISPRGKSLILSRTRISLERLAKELVDRKLTQKFEKELSYAKSKKTSEEANTQRGVSLTENPSSGGSSENDRIHKVSLRRKDDTSSVEGGVDPAAGADNTEENPLS